MQQKLCSRGSGSFLSERNGQACGASPSSLPFRCPRCGERERFRSLASLRAHLEYRHSYCSPDVTSGGFSITGKLPDPLTASIPWHDMSLPTRRGQQRPPHVRSLSDSRDSGFLPSYGSVRRRTQSVGVGTQAEEEEEDDDEEDDEEEFGSDDDDVGDDDEDEGEEKNGGRNDGDVKKSDTCPHRLNHHLFHPPAPLAPPPYPNLDLDLELVDQNQYSGLQTAAASAAVRRRLASLLRAADSTMQRRLAKVSTELAQTDTQLLCERAHSQHLAQERQEVADRERSLSRQVDVAVMVIAALREQLNASENELERQEREVITIQKFLEAAARQETCGKVRIQHFIENLLRRIALAERLVEYYRRTARSSAATTSTSIPVNTHLTGSLKAGQRGVSCPPPVSTNTGPTPTRPPRSLGAVLCSPERGGRRNGSTGSVWLSRPGSSADPSTETTSGTTSGAARPGTRRRTVEQRFPAFFNSGPT
ncbi:uncharacterized protein znf365 [Gymnodraco acuticeps]|uniref:Uncharacterized protein znf365 n=1 Tax=Gymnodraco acuticeps TaxID=8218 RepID=A0A6P8WZV4_GYMAC|nr:uncharacterized protein znf365 [Gymnodraco acuticeps]